MSMNIDDFNATTGRYTGSISADDKALLAQAVQNIADVVNHSSTKAVGVYIAHALHSQHRYLQWEAVIAIHHALSHYGETPEVLQDGRNRGAVELASKMSERA